MANNKLIMDDTAYKQEVNNRQQRVYDLAKSISALDGSSIEDNIRAIAPYHEDKVQNVVRLTNNSTILSSNNTFKNKPKYSEPESILDIYKSTGKRFFESLHDFNPHSKKVQTGSELIKNVITFNEMNYRYSKVRNNNSLDSMKETYNFFQSSEQFMAYDLETLGGVNKSGYKSFDTITEFSFKTYNKSDLANPQRIENVVGLSNMQADAYLSELNEIEKNGMSSNRLEVLANRFGKYGHADTKIDLSSPGQWKVSSFAADNAEGLTNINTIRNGINKLRSIGAEQSANKASSGLMLWQEQLAQAVSTMNSGSIPIVGYNDIGADVPWMNQFLPTMISTMEPQQRSAFLKAAGFADGQTPYVNIPGKSHLDFRTFANAAGEAVGKTAYYENNLGLLKNHTPFQQEALGRLMFPEMFENAGMAAHTAGFDVDVLAHLVADGKGTGTTLLDRMFKDASDGASKIGGSIVGDKRNLLLANMAQSYYNGGSEPMNFVHDALDNSFRTFNGYVVGQDGNASKELFGQWGIKRNRFYTLDWAGQLDMSEDWIKDIKGLHDEYAQGQLFAAKLLPVYDSAEAELNKGLQSPTYIVTTTKERLEGIMSSFMKVGERSNEHEAWRELSDPKAKDEVAAALHRVSIKDGATVTSDYRGIYDAIKFSTKQDINETAARMIREDSYSKAIKFDQLYNKLSKYVGKEDIRQDDVKGILLELMNNQSKVLSKKVASGKAMKLSYSDVQSILGFKSNNNDKLFRESLDKYTTAFDYLAGQRKVSNAIISHLNKTNQNMSSEEMQFRYEQILNSLKSKTATEMASSPEELAKHLNNTETSEIFAKDLNYFNVDMTNFFRDSDVETVGFKYKLPTSENIMRINLAPNKEYGLVNELLRRNVKKTNLTPAQKNLHGIDQLSKFVDFMQSSKDYKEIFEGFDTDKFESANSFAEAIQRRFIDYRNQKPTSGLISDLNIQNVLQENSIFSHLEENMKQTVADISDINSKLPKYKMINSLNSSDDTLLKEHVADIVDNILMPKLEIGGRAVTAAQYAEHYGFDKDQSKVMSAVYDMARTSQLEGFTKFTKGLLKTDARIAYDTEQQVLEVMLNGQSLSLNNMPRVKASNGVFYVQSGNNRLGLYSVLDARKINGNPKKKWMAGTGKFDPTDVKLTTTLGRAYDNAFDPINAMEKGVQDGNVLNRVQSYVADLASQVRGGSAISKMDIVDSYTSLRLDYTDLYDLIPKMHEAGALNGVDWRDNGFMEIAKNKNLSYSTLSSLQRETIQKNIPMLLKLASGNRVKGEPFENNILQFIANNISFSNKDVQVSEGTGMFGVFSPKAGAQFDNNSRPVINQATRSVLYRTSQWEKALAGSDFKNRNIAIGSVIDNHSSKALLNRTSEGLAKNANKTSTILQVGKANMSHVEFQHMITKDFLSKQSIRDMNEKDRKIFDVLKNLNLNEQEKIIDPRIMNEFFNRIDEQKINAKKQVSLSLEVNMKTLEQVQELRNVVPVLNIKNNGEIVFEYQKGKYVSRLDHVLNVAGFGDRDQIYGAKADVGKFNFGYFTKDGILANENDVKSTLAGVKDVTEAYRRLDEKYDAAFYVKSAERVNYKKMANGFVEKDMAYAPMFGAGQLDDRVHQYLGTTDFRKLRGRVLNDETINDIVNDFGNKSQLRAKIFKSKDELRKALYDEQYAAWDRLKEMFPANMDIGMIANHATDKHGNRMLAFEEAVSSMVEVERSRGALSNKDALSKVSNHLKNAGVIGIEGADVDPETGKILMPNQLRGGEDFLDMKNMRELAEKQYPELLWKDESGKTRFGRKLEYDGKTVGTYGRSPISEVSDFQGTTSSGPLDSMNKIVSLRAEKRALKAQGESYDHLDNQIEELKASYNAISRGKKITDREVGLLNLQKYDSGFIDTYNQAIKDKTISESEVTDILGHVLKKDGSKFARDKNGGFILDDKVKGRSVLSGYTESLSGRLLYDETQNDVLFDEDYLAGIKHTKDGIINGPKPYDDLITPEISKFYKKGRDISVEKTEQLYSMAKGMQAIEWNAGTYTNLDHMTGQRGFRSVKLEDVATDVGNDASFILKHDNNIFNKNLLIDLGEDAGKAYSDRYVALPFAPGKVSGENVIKLEFQKQINTIISRKDNIAKARAGEGNISIEKATAAYKESIQDFKNILNENITGKNGVAGQAASIRETLSVNGKSSFIMFNDPNRMINAAEGFLKKDGNDKAAARLKDIGKSMKILADENGTAALNDSILSTAKFGEKTLLEHFQAGRSIDARFVSEDAFRRMGYFDKKYMKDTLGTESEDTMRKFLSTYGTMSDTTRYPSIKEGSTKPTLIYLNDKLSGNRTQMTASGALAAVADNDGDLIASSIIRDKGNRDYLAYRAGKASNTAYWKDIEASVMHRAIGVNKFWDNEAYGIMKKDIEGSINNGDLFTITGSAGVDKKIFAEFGVSPSAQAVADNSNLYKEFQTKFNLPDRKEKQYIGALDNALESIKGTADYDRYKKAAIFEEAFGNYEVGQIAKVRKLTIGEVNVPLFRLRKAAELAIDPSVEGNTAAQHIIQQTSEVIEQEVISAKKGNVREYVTKAEEFSKSLNGMLYGNQDSRRQSANDMKAWLNKNARKELVEEATKLNSITKEYFDTSGKNSDEIFTEMSDRFISAVTSLNNNQVRAIKDFEKVGTQLKGIGTQKVSNILQGIPEKSIDFTHDIWNVIADTGILDGTRTRATEEFYSETSEAMKKAATQKAILSDSREWLQGESTGQKMKSVLKSTGEVFEKISKGFDGKTLAIGALGLAGAYLVAGFVGGNPSRPADTQAMEDGQGYEVPSLLDPELQNAQPNKQPGYVVNINAKTNKDKQYASQAINSAVSQNYNTNVNISMNITDDNGNINDRYVEQLLAGAIS